MSTEELRWFRLQPRVRANRIQLSAQGQQSVGKPDVAGELMSMNILSIQSWVSYGHVGNASAIFPLQRLGAEVWAINTVQFSNHTGYGDWTGAVYSGQSVRELVDGIAARGALKRCDAVLTGYVGGPDIGDAILHAVTMEGRTFHLIDR